MRLYGKTAVITGAARGIGKAIACKFMQEGARVLICDLREESLSATQAELSALGEVHVVSCDVSDEKQIEQLTQQALTLFGRIDILVNNAGIAMFENFLDIQTANWDQTM